MEESSQHEREVRAARNQSLFRAVNERIATLNEAFASMTEVFVIACECADSQCIEQITIAADDYHAIRVEPRHFAVLPDHVYLDVERVVREDEGYVVVEKFAAAGATAEELAEQAPVSGEAPSH